MQKTLKINVKFIWDRIGESASITWIQKGHNAECRVIYGQQRDDTRTNI